jgi:hypothetical protein
MSVHVSIELKVVLKHFTGETFDEISPTGQLAISGNTLYGTRQWQCHRMRWGCS